MIIKQRQTSYVARNVLVCKQMDRSSYSPFVRCCVCEGRCHLEARPCSVDGEGDLGGEREMGEVGAREAERDGEERRE